MAFSSKILPIVYKKMTIIPSKMLPVNKAPRHEILIKAFSLIPCPLINILIALKVVL